MELVRIDIAEVADLGTQVAMHGAVRMGEISTDEVFELIVGMIALVVEITS